MWWVHEMGSKMFFPRWKEAECFQMELGLTRDQDLEGVEKNVDIVPHEMKCVSQKEALLRFPCWTPT